VNVLPITAVVAALQAEVADLMARDLNMLGEIVGKSSAGTPAAAQTTQTNQASQASAATPTQAPTPNAPDAPAPNPVAQAVSVARAEAAGRQGSLAPLMADLAQAQESPALPAPVRAAIGQVLALQTPLAGPLTAQVVARAVAQSGLFLEAHLAGAQGQPPTPDLKAALLTLQQALSPPSEEAPQPPLGTNPGQPPAPSQSPSANPPATQSPARSAAPQPAAPQSAAVPSPPAAARTATPAGPPAPDLKTAVQVLQQAVTAPAGGATALPAPLKAALVQLLAPPVPAGGAPPAQTVAKAVAQLAPLLEAYLAAPQEEPVPPEVKAALQTLQQTLTSSPDDKPALPQRAPPPSPPSRDGATTAQAAARPTLPETADAQTITQVLARGVDQALARQTLHQLASLPDGPSQAWMFELPIATPQGAAIAQFQVDRDGQGAGGGEGGDASWRVRFSIDIEPLGPVHVQLSAGGERAAVTVWAERPDGLVRLRSLGGELARALPADVRFQGGAPRQAAPPPGRFVDQSS
jgi:hypothetical protein